MRALVVYESMFGNTRDVAEAVADGLRPHGPVDVVEVGQAPAAIAEDVALLVVGGPTHAFGMSRPRTRADAANRVGGDIVSADRGIREWLEEVQPGAARHRAAAFDTRVRVPLLPGSAARAALRRLRRRGFDVAGSAMSFYVGGMQGPVRPGELTRAQEWGATLATKHT